MSQLLSAMKGIMDALKGGGGGGGGDSGGGGFTGSPGCSTFYQTSIQGNPDPCSYYVPEAILPVDPTFPTTTYPTIPGPSNPVCTTYTPTTVVNNPDPCTTYTPQTTNTNQPPVTATVTPTAKPQGFFSILLNNVVGLRGVRGNIEVTGNRGTIYVGNADQKTNTSVVGFYGSNGAQSQSVIGRLCISRPWAKTFLSFLIPPTFFDGLCKARGYQGGAAASGTALVAKKVATPRLVIPTSAQAATTTQGEKVVTPQADIWAAPSSVPLGSRTTVFWNSRGARSCIVTGPDGSFSETTLSGGASTVPIVAKTVFTISCLAPDGSHVVSTTTVDLKI